MMKMSTPEIRVGNEYFTPDYVAGSLDVNVTTVRTDPVQIIPAALDIPYMIQVPSGSSYAIPHTLYITSGYKPSALDIPYREYKEPFRDSSSQNKKVNPIWD
jgi:hypothetical protein